MMWSYFRSVEPLLLARSVVAGYDLHEGSSLATQKEQSGHSNAHSQCNDILKYRSPHRACIAVNF